MRENWIKNRATAGMLDYDVGWIQGSAERQDRRRLTRFTLPWIDCRQGRQPLGVCAKWRQSIEPQEECRNSGR